MGAEKIFVVRRHYPLLVLGHRHFVRVQSSLPSSRFEGLQVEEREPLCHTEQIYDEAISFFLLLPATRFLTN